MKIIKSIASWFKRIAAKIKDFFNPKSKVNGKGNHPNPSNLIDKIQ